MSNPITVAIGTEPMQLVPCQVLKSSIRRRTEREVRFAESWCEDGGWHSAIKRAPRLKQGTAFNVWRWLLPDVVPGGRVIYLDADQVCLTDTAELWDTPLYDCTIAAVKNAVGIFGKKRQPEPGKIQTSVMLVDLDSLHAWSASALLEQTAKGVRTYAELMQAAWMPAEGVLELPPEWNHFGIHTEQTKILHWSHVKSQPYRCPEHPTAWVFERELLASVEAGHVTRAIVEREVQAGHLHRHWLDVLG